MFFHATIKSMREMNKSLQYTCIFGGGAIRGVSYVGAIKALEEIGICPNTIAGSSVGAIFAGLFAVGYNAEELKDILVQVNYELFRDIHFGFGKDFALSKGGIFLDWIRDLIEQKYYGENYKKGENPPVTFKDLKKNVIVITTDLTNFKYKEFSKFETPDFEIAYAIRISSSMPGLMKPVTYEDSILVDGDLQKSLPLWKCSKHLCLDNERVLEFRLEGEHDGECQNAIDFINTVYSCVTSIATDSIIESYGNQDKFDYIKINTGSVVIVDFNQSKEKRQMLMEIGYTQTREYFSLFLINKKQTIVKHYRTLSKQLKKIEKCILSGNFKQAKSEIGFLYIELCGIKKIIDRKHFEMINEFKDDFMLSLSPASFFGIYSLKNPEKLKSQIKSINIEIEEMIMELESYIFKI